MGAVVISLAIVVGLPLFLLALPVELVFRVSGVEEFKAQMAVRWLFGAVRRRVRMPGGGPPPTPLPTEPRDGAAGGKLQAHRSRDCVLTMLRQAAFRQRTYRLVADLARATHLRQLHLHARLGLGDPADTGRLWGLLGPLVGMARSLPWATVRVEPEFVEPVLEFQARGRMRLIPLQILLLGFVFALSSASRQAWRTVQRRHAAA